MSYRLFVRDFFPGCQIGDLENLFSEVGTVNKVTLTDRDYNGTPRRVAYVEMASAEDMHHCIDRFHGMKFNGYTLTVTMDRAHVPDPNFSYKRPKQNKRVSPPKG